MTTNREYEKNIQLYNSLAVYIKYKCSLRIVFVRSLIESMT